ncbi:hypothetical protein [Burkholderia ambifaria]|uniref:hypothetical protein n=1 Tax=Burkholderia ambifaria TaxID=152480 RepID=UPI0015893EED|nr:hypothetical protein [Burkholderia ambifaria]WDR86119.1 hypothetical protein OR986_06795 [Burkholderia ambifaria]WDR98751.1 hypothetical protein OR985_11755 [Burkholderia ambifaria]
MSKESNDVADLRHFAVSLCDELAIVSEEVARLMHRLDAYQMGLEGRRVAHQDQQTVLREIVNHARILATKPAARERSSASSWSTSLRYWLRLVDQAARNQAEQRRLRRQLPHQAKPLTRRHPARYQLNGFAGRRFIHKINILRELTIRIDRFAAPPTPKPSNDVMRLAGPD